MDREATLIEFLDAIAISAIEAKRAMEAGDAEECSELLADIERDLNRAFSKLDSELAA